MLEQKECPKRKTPKLFDIEASIVRPTIKVIEARVSDIATSPHSNYWGFGGELIVISN